MCLICIDLKKDKLTTKEARRNLDEAVDVTDDHYWEVLIKIMDKEEKEDES